MFGRVLTVVILITAVLPGFLSGQPLRSSQLPTNPAEVSTSSDRPRTGFETIPWTEQTIRATDVQTNANPFFSRHIVVPSVRQGLTTGIFVNPLSNPDATNATQALYRFLANEFGHVVFSGQQNLEDIAYVTSLTGEEPAIGGFDLMDYSPSRRERGARTRRSVERWIEWARDDGIVTLSWHWNAPAELLDLPGREWWRGFYSNATTFRLRSALRDANSAEFGLLLRDIDAIAAELKKFSDANVPVLWRPLHEASGAWFWWGASGPDAFKSLWRLMYDRLVVHHGLNNLIWVYTHDPVHPGWYPGDDVVDILGLDVYTEPDPSLLLNFQNTVKRQFGNRMLVALTELGTLPDPEEMQKNGIWWSWFTIWSGSFIRSIDPERLKQVYQHPAVTNRSDLKAWRTTDFSSPLIVADEPGLEVYPNPSQGHVTLRVVLPVSVRSQIRIINVLGRVVRSIPVQTTPNVVFSAEVDLSDQPAGLYIADFRTDAKRLVARFIISKR